MPRPEWDLPLKGSMVAAVPPSEPFRLLGGAQPPDYGAQPLPSWLGFLCQEKKDVGFSSAVTGQAHSFHLDGWVRMKRILSSQILGLLPSPCFLLLMLLRVWFWFGGFSVFVLFCFVLFVETKEKILLLVGIRQSQ